MFSAPLRLATRRQRFIPFAALTAVLALTAACETAGERALREEREAYIETLDLEELKGSLKTTNPDPYNDGTIRKHVGGMNK